MGKDSGGQVGGLLSYLALKEPPTEMQNFLQELSERGEVYVTGGAVRDILRGERVEDLDLTVVNLSPRKVAEEAARKLSWALVPLHEEFGVFRVARGGFSLDISGLRPGATNIEDDLRLRDFSFNALAVSLGEALERSPSDWTLLDPCQGLRDLKAGLIRAISRKNLIDDPLRILRAYRFYALGFGEIEAETRMWLSEVRAGLLKVARERIVYELMLILQTRRAGDTFFLMFEDEVLFEIFPELAETGGVSQPPFHHLDVLGHSLLALSRAEEILEAPGKFFGDSEPFEKLLLDPERRIAVKLAALFHDLGKPRTFAVRDRITFYDHEKVGARIFLERAERLRFKKDLAKRVAHLIRNHMRPFHLLAEREKGRLTARAKRRLLRDVPEYPDLFVVAMADSLAAKGPDKDPGEEEKLAEFFREIHEFYRETLRKVERKRLVSGRDLIDIFGLAPGPIFRELLEAVEEARVEGRVTTREEALEYLAEILNSNPSFSQKIRART